MANVSEIEIKLRLDPREIEKFVTLEVLGGSNAEGRRLRTIYFDDERRRLTRNGLELRVRSSGHAHMQTVKSGRGLTRGEWEAAVSGEAPEREAARGTPAQKFLKKGAELKPIFVVDVERRSWRVEKDGDVAEISLDFGEIASDERNQQIAEAEIELKAGSPQFLFDLARKVIHRCDAPPSFVGKALRGRRLAEGLVEHPQPTIDLDLKPGTTTISAFRQIVDACLQQASLNEEILRRQPGDVETTHQLRVAIRRLRAALTLFSPLIAGEPLDALKRELKWFSGLLGEARDLDVFVTKTIEKARGAHPGVSSLDELRNRSVGLRQTAHQKLDDALHSERFRLLFLDLVEFAHVGAWESEADRKKSKLRGMSAEAFAARQLERRLNAIVGKKNRERIVGANEANRHQLRIKAKKLLYMAEYFQSLAAAKCYGTTAKALHAVQESLGAVHDGVAAEQIISKLLVKENKADLAFAAGLLRQDLTKANCIAVACAAHDKLQRATPFWRAF